MSSYIAEGPSLAVLFFFRLVCGINNKGIQNKLLAETDLTYGKAWDIARSLEVAAQNLQDLRATSRTPGNGVSQHDNKKKGACKEYIQKEHW